MNVHKYNLRSRPRKASVSVALKEEKLQEDPPKRRGNRKRKSVTVIDVPFHEVEEQQTFKKPTQKGMKKRKFADVEVISASALTKAKKLKTKKVKTFNTGAGKGQFESTIVIEENLEGKQTISTSTGGAFGTSTVNENNVKTNANTGPKAVHFRLTTTTTPEDTAAAAAPAAKTPQKTILIKGVQPGGSVNFNHTFTLESGDHTLLAPTDAAESSFSSTFCQNGNESILNSYEMTAYEDMYLKTCYDSYRDNKIIPDWAKDGDDNTIQLSLFMQQPDLLKLMESSNNRFFPTCKARKLF